MSILDPHPILYGTPMGGVRVHGIMFAAAALLGTAVLGAAARRLRLPTERVLPSAVAAFLAGLAAARIGYVLTYPDASLGWGGVLAYWQGGLVSYWGIAGGLLAGWLLVRREPRETRRMWLDAAVIAGLAAWALGRWGNYWAYESYGALSPHWSAFYGRIPIQLFESAACLALAVAGWLALGRAKPGMAGLWLLFGYFASRALIDSWRVEGTVAGVHPSQALSGLAAILLIGIIHARVASARRA